MLKSLAKDVDVNRLLDVFQRAQTNENRSGFNDALP